MGSGEDRLAGGALRMPPTPGKFAATLEQIAQAERMSVGAVNVCLSRALKKLRRAGLLKSARELANELERGRNTENIVRAARGR